MATETQDVKRKYEDSDDESPVGLSKSIHVGTSFIMCLLLNICMFPEVRKVEKSRLCPYLDTINRTVLDFDFEKLCSVTLTRINVYACLVCGKYFQGNYIFFKIKICKH